MPRHDKPMSRPPGASIRARGAAAVVLVVYLVLLGAAVFWPSPIDRPAAAFLQDTALRLYELGLPPWFDYARLEWSANVALFIPFGLLAGLILPRRYVWLAGVCGIAASIGIETAQSVFLPLRYATVNDVAANSIGAVFGAGLAYLLHARPRARRRAPFS
ncbi:VanZ family protein [Arthrobacter sp. zg-Y40]|uniref:VanZ family protein n=1 Tax=unclassified Arthrobacter TaxID=235627 RepID=UPI001D15C662|nr:MULTISPECIES: VanZ family protein [unclassified Arthrobacter]MCC3277248.1 VanZ family protein [Arthrobacter sp. zg-Y20]MCC3280189.1 VanZ family protein [Arthrobacter sp. zg-Y40]MDK1317408.1 VanZ family protein [Arthrobacter sp. zg.Y20]MDK1328458.1 VanZ family protein [Arthrobacter sp. zg-Y1143]WIB07181.1 VanZ family protein [Arthrobacter sp. zg-Y20]